MARRVGRALITGLRRGQEPLFLTAVGLVTVGATLLPLVVLVGRSISPGSHGLVGGLAALAAPQPWMLLGRSLGVATLTSALALPYGGLLAVLLGKTNVKGRRWALLVHAFPMFLPPFLLALGWFHLFGRRGLVGSESTSAVLFSDLGAVGVMALTFAPVVTSLVTLGLQGVDPSFEEAARVVAPARRVVARILLPLTWPAAALAVLLVFALALSELGVPMFLRVDTYPAAVFAHLGGVDYTPGEAFALVLPLFMVALLLLALERRLIGRRSFAALGLRLGERPVIPLGRWRSVATVGCWLAAALSVAPIVSLAVVAGRGGFARAPAWIGAGLQNSLLTAGTAASVIVALGLILGRAVARGRPGAGILDAVTVLGFVTPAAVLGVGLIALWNHPATQAVYGGTAIIVIAFVARYLAIGSRTVAAAVVQSSPHLEEAAAAFGGTFLRRLLRIVLPVHARSVTAAWLLALVFCLRDVETAVLIYPAGGETLPVRIFTLEANGPEPVVAALAVVQVGVIATILALGAALLLRRRRA